ncbi:MAG: TetR/AcrR family transcriptional regulator [Actinomycetes bacterium]|jgi:AcrR family transcriptional regulator
MAHTQSQVGKAGYHHGDLEAALLAQARIFVAEQGADKVSMREVAASLGVSPSAVYHHFSDRIALLSAVGRIVFDDIADFQESALLAHPGKSLAAASARLRTLGLAYVEFAQANPHLFRLCFGPLCVDPVAAADMEGALRKENRAWNLLVTGLDELAAAGGVDPKIRPNAEIMVWSAIHGVATLILDGLLPPDAVYPLLDTVSISLMGQVKKTAAPPSKLLPQLTSDEVDYDRDDRRDREIAADKPPHHG